MTALFHINGRDVYDVLVIRTDFSDESGWRALAGALAESGADDPAGGNCQVVNDPAWADASVGQVLAALQAEPEDCPHVVFLADRAAMRPGHAVLAVTTLAREDCEDDEDYAAELEYGRQFRIVPGEVAALHANMATANMEFCEFSSVAAADLGGVFRGFPR